MSWKDLLDTLDLPATLYERIFASSFMWPYVAFDVVELRTQTKEITSCLGLLDLVTLFSGVGIAVLGGFITT